MEIIKHVVREIHRRSLWQVVAIYLVGSWIAYQVILGPVQGVGLPEWVPAFAIVLFLIGLPIVIATAFIQEGGPTRATFMGGSDNAGSARAGSGAQAPPASGVRQGVTTEAPTAATTGTTAADRSDAGRSGGLQRLLTWRRSLAAGVLAFALLVAGAIGYSGMRVLGIGPAGTLAARGLIDEGEPIVLADFATTAADPQVGRIVTEALRIDLLQSEAVQLAGHGLVATGLRHMNRDLADGLPEGVARELAVQFTATSRITSTASRTGARASFSCEEGSRWRSCRRFRPAGGWAI